CDVSKPQSKAAIDGRCRGETIDDIESPVIPACSESLWDWGCEPMPSDVESADPTEASVWFAETFNSIASARNVSASCWTRTARLHRRARMAASAATS